NRQKSSAPDANQPKTLTPTTVTCADWPIHTSGREKRMRKRSSCITELLNLIPISLRRMPQPRGVLACARDLGGSLTERKRLRRLEGWLDWLCNWVKTTLRHLVSPDTCSPMLAKNSMMALPSLIEHC